MPLLSFIFITAFLTAFNIHSAAQKTALDSSWMKEKIFVAEDTNRLTLLNTIASALQLNDKAKLAKAYSLMAVNCDNKKDKGCFLDYNRKALALYELLGDKYGIQKTLRNIAWVSDFPEAIQLLLQSLRINQALNNTKGMALDCGALGFFYNEAGNYSKSLEFHQKAIEIFVKVDDKTSLGFNLNCIARTYNNLGQNQKAIIYFERGRDVLEKSSDTQELLSSLEGLGSSYTNLGNYPAAFTWFQKALALSQSIGYKEGICVSLMGIGSTLAFLPDEILIENNIKPSERFDRSLDYLKHAEQLNPSENLRHGQYIQLCLSRVYKAKKDFPKALEAYQRYISIRDSFVSGEKQRQIGAISIQYEFSRREDSINLQQAITGNRLAQQELLSKQQQQQLTIANKEKELQRLAYLSSQTALQNEQLQKKEKERQLSLSAKESELQKSKMLTLAKETQLTDLKLKRQWLYTLAGIFILVLITSFLLYRNRQQQLHLKTQLAKEKTEQQLKEAEFQKKMSELTLNSLQSQMNPHFIFNCLNSIKLYAEENDSSKASEYISKFSRLIRLVLENSKAGQVTLATELEALELYIQMEAMRFKDKLQYRIQVDETVDTQYTEVPPLLIQPYVENAVWHGLLHKENGGHIYVSIKGLDDKNRLIVHIEDNGIGRKKAIAFKSKAADKNKSLGMQVTAERMHLADKMNNTSTEVQIDDLYDKNNEPAGTCVTLKIPSI